MIERVVTWTVQTPNHATRIPTVLSSFHSPGGILRSVPPSPSLHPSQAFTKWPLLSHSVPEAPAHSGSSRRTIICWLLFFLICSFMSYFPTGREGSSGKAVMFSYSFNTFLAPRVVWTWGKAFSILLVDLKTAAWELRVPTLHVARSMHMSHPSVGALIIFTQVYTRTPQVTTLQDKGDFYSI